MPLHQVTDLGTTVHVKIDGDVHKGDLVANDAALFCQWTKGGMMTRKQTRQTPLLLWSDVVSYRIEGQEQRGGVGAALNHTTEHAWATLTLNTATDVRSYTFKNTGPAQLTNRIGKFVAGVPRQN
jgi:hypothetical protein